MTKSLLLSLTEELNDSMNSLKILFKFRLDDHLQRVPTLIVKNIEASNVSKRPIK